MSSAIIIAGAAALAFILLLSLAKFCFRVAEPNEALIISGMGAKGSTAEVGDSLGFRIVSGKGTFVIPILQTARSLDLDHRRISLNMEAVSRQSIPVQLRAVAIFKVGDDYASIANAARRFLGKQAEMEESVKEMAHGQMRTIVGSMSIEELIQDREALTAQVLTSCQTELQKLGLHLDSFQI